MSKAVLWSLYNQATDEDLLMSRRDVHTFGLDSYVLRKDAKGRLVRVFHIRGNMLQGNYPYSPSYSIGIHNHRYDLAMVGVQGRAINYTWKRGGSLRTDQHSLYEFEWRTHIDGKGSSRLVGLANLTLDSAQELREGERRFVANTALHTVWAEPGAAWIIYEGETNRETTSMFSQHREPDTRGLYHKFDDLRDVRESFERAFT